MVLCGEEMEFTPKKQPLSVVTTSAIRHNPHVSGGEKFMRKYKQNRNGLSTPRSTLMITPTRSSANKIFTSRAGRILATSKNTSTSKNNETVNNKQKTSQAIKRPFSDVNELDNSNNPFNIFSESEEENQPSPKKESKNGVLRDKENLSYSSDDEIFLLSKNKERKVQALSERGNSLFNTPKSSVKVYSNNKRKPSVVLRSRLLSDISPTKVEKAFGTKTTLSEEKENVPAKSYTESSDTKVLVPHLIGFPNYGNTCYLNSVLQSLLGLPTFLCDYRQIASEVGLNNQTSLFYGLSQVLYNRMKGQASGVKVSLRTVKENLERIDRSFSGFKMQDANEFLTKFLDIIKDEIDHCHAGQRERSSPESKANEDIDEDLLLSGVVGNSAMKRLCFTANEVEDRSDDFTDSDIINCVSAESEKGKCLGKETPNGSLSLKISDSCGRKPEEIGRLSSVAENILRNPVKDNFEFQLLESYRCLGCGEVEGRRQEYFGLYVNLPDDGGQTIQDAISTYMSADERELKCEKCGHESSSVVTTVEKLPRILIIQLKRYEYKPEQHESIKMSSRVQVNRWICLDQFMTDDAAGPSQWDPERDQVNKKPRPNTLSVRNLSSELNTCDQKEDGELPSFSPTKSADGMNLIAADTEDEELQMVMRRSMEDVQGGQEEDEIQQAIRLSLQEMGMSYSQENQDDDEQSDKKEQAISVDENEESGRHSYCLISVISHFGLTTNTGHYVSDVYNCDEDSWFHYDDESVAKISESVVFAEGRQKNGYIFFYMHKDLFQKVKSKDNR